MGNMLYFGKDEKILFLVALVMGALTTVSIFSFITVFKFDFMVLQAFVCLFVFFFLLLFKECFWLKS
jgi:hypothetical protein